MNSKKIAKTLLKLAVSCVFIAWLVFEINWNEVLFYIGQIKPWQIILYYIILVFGMVISSYKWKMLALYKNISLPIFDFFKYYLAGTFVNNFMPSFIGGDAFKAYQIGKIEKKYKEATATIVVDRITGLLGGMILAVIFGIINYKSVSQSEMLLTIDVIVFILILAATVFLFIRKISFWKSISNKLPKRIIYFLQTLNDFAENGILFKSIMLSFAFAFVGLAGSNYVLFLALGVDINILDYLSIIFLISIVSSIPVSINNIGIKEWAYVTFFGLFGIGSSMVVTIAILSRFLQMLISFIALPIYIKSKK